MDLPIGTLVVGEAGLRGHVSDHVTADDGAPAVLLKLDDGSQVRILSTLLVPQADGTASMPLRREDILQVTRSGDSEYRVLPVIVEELEVSKRVVERGRVRVRKLVHEHDEVVDEPLFAEQVEVTRVPINRQIDAPPAIRQEGDTLIVPVIEEMLVVEKRLFLKEELHIIRRQTSLRNPQTVTLRSEELVVERLPLDDNPANTQPDQASDRV